MIERNIIVFNSNSLKYEGKSDTPYEYISCFDLLTSKRICLYINPGSNMYGFIQSFAGKSEIVELHAVPFNKTFNNLPLYYRVSEVFSKVKTEIKERYPEFYV